jgi:hypothetical protein
MSGDSKTYRRLPHQGVSAFRRADLYLGPDHLIAVSSNGYTESYKRFYFPDIKAITLRKTVHGKIWNLFWGSLTTLSALIAVPLSGGAQIAWFGVATAFSLGLLLNLIFGPSCACQIRTAVQTCPLPSLNRLNRARQTIAQLRPQIEASQPSLPIEEITARLDEARRSPSVTPVALDANSS